MRTVSFVDCFELEFEGSVFSKAMLASDVDNDNVSINVVSPFVIKQQVMFVEFSRILSVN